MRVIESARKVAVSMRKSRARRREYELEEGRKDKGRERSELSREMRDVGN